MNTEATVLARYAGQPQRFHRELRLGVGTTTVSELLRQYVKAEVGSHGPSRLKELRQRLRWLIVPRGSERRLNGSEGVSGPGAFQSADGCDIDSCVEAALSAFRANRILMLFDDRPLTDLDEELVLTGDEDASFLELIPLKGG